MHTRIKTDCDCARCKERIYREGLAIFSRAFTTADRKRIARECVRDFGDARIRNFIDEENV